MRIKKCITLLGIILLHFALISCEKESEGNETKVSRNFENDSHNNGQNCMICHVSGGGGEGWFNIAGSTYDATKVSPSPNGKVELFTETNATGTLVKTIEVDSKGNFYTTENVAFGNGLYVAFTDMNGNEKRMGSKITTGQCNSCHGISTDVIHTN